MSAPEAVQLIQQTLQRGNFGRADILCRRFIETMPDNYPWPRVTLAHTALKIGEISEGWRWCDEAQSLIAGHAPGAYPEVETEIAQLRWALGKAEFIHQRDGYLLIKCWGYGFWSDIEHVLSSLLLAEMTGRIPIVHWGANSYYIDDGNDEAFATLYEAIAPLSLDELAALSNDIYPPKYRRDNLDAVMLDMWEGPYSRLSGLYLLNRPERIVVSDFFTQITELLPWLGSDHWLFGAGVCDAIRLLYEKYLVPAADIKADIDAFVAENFTHRPVLGIHVRNIDKAVENSAFTAEFTQTMPLVEARLKTHPDFRLFIMTDSSPVLDQYTEKFGDRLFHIDCQRTDSSKALTWREHDDRRRLGAEIIKDTHIAAACDYFIGHGASNVACMVACLKQWPDNTFHLIGDNVKISRNWLLHDW